MSTSTTEAATPCPHDGRLRGQCIRCLNRHMIANMEAWEAFALDEGDCMIIRGVIDEFCDRHASFYGVEYIDADLCERIMFWFEGNGPVVVELIEILLFG